MNTLTTAIKTGALPAKAYSAIGKSGVLSAAVWNIEQVGTRKRVIADIVSRRRSNDAEKKARDAAAEMAAGKAERKRAAADVAAAERR